MSFSVNVRLGELSSTTSLSELSASVTISGGLLRSIPFSANKDTDLEFADTITFSVDNPSPDVEYIWRLEDGQGFNLKEGSQVKQDYTDEGQFDVKVLGHYLDQQRLEGVGYAKDFVKVTFTVPDQLLDDVPGAAAAYSIRLLRAGYSGGLLRVRAVDSNGTDQGEADVQDDPATKGREITLNSPIKNLDSIATGRGLSNSDTLGDLVDLGISNYDGFVPKWYDQSPNARHATNTTASEQPQIVDSGKLITENGKPAMDFKKFEDFFRTSAFSPISLTAQSWFVVHKIKTYNQDFGRIVTQALGNTEDNDLSGNIVPLLYNDVPDGIFSDVGQGLLQDYPAPTGKQILNEMIFNQSGTELFDNGVSKATTNVAINTDIDRISINQKVNGSFGIADEVIQEIVMYPQDISSNQTTARQNINDFFNIP